VQGGAENFDGSSQDSQLHVEFIQQPSLPAFVTGEPEELTLISQPTEIATSLQLECVMRTKLDKIAENETASTTPFPRTAT
jgi:hypothetical protein